MEIEEFREELQGLKFNENKWQEKMMMVTRLYKSLGYGLKDIDESVLIDKVYFYIGDLLNRIIRPNDEDFYKYVLFMDELSDVNKIKGRLTKERLKETLLSDDRITDVSDFEFKMDGNKLNVKFIVHSIYGELEEETVVIY